MTQRKPVALITFCLISLFLFEGSSAAQGFQGKWRHIEFVEDESSKVDCRRLRVIVRKYDLQNSSSGYFTGNYSREQRILWLGPISGCPSGMTPGADPNAFRMDGWIVGARLGRSNKLDISGRYKVCAGSCGDGARVDRQFLAKLRWKKGHLIDDDDDGYSFVFWTELASIRMEQEASQQMPNLMKPLYEGNCNEFYEQHLHPVARERIPKAALCREIRKIGALMPDVLYTKPLTATHFMFGRFSHPITGLVKESEGGRDVLVEQMFVLRPDGHGVPVAAVLRKQDDGRWKVWDPAP